MRLERAFQHLMALFVAALLVVTLAIAVSFRPMPAPDTPRAHDLMDPRPLYDSMLRLARAADVAYDADYPGRGVFQVPDSLLVTLPDVAADIAAQIAEEDLGLPGRMPASVAWVDYGPDRNSVAGRYSLRGDVSLNVRYRDDPAWRTIPWLGVLVHEMIHAQYVFSETRTEILTWEVMSALAALDYPGARYDLLRSLRLDALVAAWWMAAYERPLLLSDTETHRYCGSGQCPLPTGDTSRVDAVRHELLDPVEWRRTEKRMRWWLHTSGEDYAAVIETYVARVLGTLIPAACSADPVVADASVAAVVAGGMPMTLPIPLPAFRVDDMRATLIEIGGCS